MTTAERISQILARYDTALSDAEAAVLSRVNSALESSYQRLEEKILKAYSNQGENQNLLARQRSLLILDEVSTYLELLNPEQRKQVQSNLEQLLRGSYERGLRLSDELSRAIANEKLASFAAVPLEAVKLQAQESARRLFRWPEEMQRKISGIVEGHLVMGSGARKMAESLRQELGVVKGRAEAIARTESLASLNLAAQANYRRNGVEYVQVQVTRDDRLCPVCAARAGNVYEMGQIAVPLHVRCRCYLLPYRKEWAELGLTNDEWHQEFRQEAIAELRRDGRQPNYGLSPFEKAQGLTEPPTPIWKPGEPQPRSPLSEELVKWETRRVNAKVEYAGVFALDGTRLLEKKGQVDSVTFTDAEVALMKGAVLSHNHPRDNKRSRKGSSFSKDDFDFAFTSDLAEIRAVSGEFVYRLRPGVDGFNLRDWDERGSDLWDKIAEEEIAKVRQWKQRQIDAGKMQLQDIKSEMNFRVWHAISERLAQELGLDYRREPLENP